MKRLSHGKTRHQLDRPRETAGASGTGTYEYMMVLHSQSSAEPFGGAT